MTKVLFNEGIETNSSTTNLDTIEVYLHEVNFPYAMKHKVKTLLKTNGTFTCVFPSSVIGSNYFIAIHHRNTVETWSASAVPFTQTTSYDFSTNLNKAYGNNQINMGNNVAAIYTGDMNQDGIIDVFDYLLIDPDIMNGNGGYLTTDLNGDGSVDVFDYLILYNGVTNGIGVEKP